jgi:DNA-directed RNA polymerase beta subunit
MDRYPDVHPIVHVGNIGEMTEEEKKKLDIDPLALLKLENDIEKELFVYQGFSKFLIENYDTFIMKLQTGILSKIVGTIQSGQTGRFYIENVQIGLPMITDNVTMAQRPLYPNEARIMQKTYSARMTGDMIFEYSDGTNMLRESKHVDICSLPVMLGSSICHLHGKSGRELLDYGECGNDPLGYFCIKGNERLVLIQVRSRGNRQLMYIDTRKDKKDRLINSMTCNSLTSTSLVVTSLITVPQSKEKEYHITLGAFSNSSVNVYCIYNLYGITDPVEITKSILSFADPKFRRRMSLELLGTISSYKMIPDVWTYIQNKVNLSSGKTKPLDQQWLGQAIDSQLFPHMNDAFTDEHIFERKLGLLSMMIVKLLMFRIGERSLDDRDSWVYKRLDTAGKSFEHLFLREYAKHIKKIETELQKVTRQINVDTVAGLLSPSGFSERLENAFTPGRWSTKNDAYRSMTDILTRANIATVYSHITRISVPSARKGKTIKARNVVMSQLGYVCPSESPEGQVCGLNLNLASTAYISSDGDKEAIYRYIKDYIKFDRTDELTSPILINGIFIGWCNGQYLKKLLIEAKRRCAINYTTCIVLEDNILNVHCDASRPLRPLLIVNPETQELVIKEKNMFRAPFDELLRNGCVEYVEPWEQGYLYIAQSAKHMLKRRETYNEIKKEISDCLAEKATLKGKGIDDPEIVEINKRLELYRQSLEKAKGYLNYTHCEINPNSMFGIVARMIPMAERSQAARNTYECNMGKQSLSLFSSSRGYRFDGTQKTIMFPQRTFFRTLMDDYLGTDTMPSGENIVLALSTHYGRNQEDAVVINKAAIDRGLFRMFIYHSYKNEALVAGTSFEEVFAKPPIKTDADRKKFRFIDVDGIPFNYDHIFEKGDCIIGKVRVYGNGNVEDASTYVGIGEGGRLDKVLVSIFENRKIAFVKLREERIPQAGDKVTSRYAQKATIGTIISQEDMPFTASGIIPAILMNPMAMPSRQTIGQLFEVIASKAASIVGENVDASTYGEFNLEKWQSLLFDHGFSPSGEEAMYDGTTGKWFTSTIYIGPCYYQLLRHLVIDKIQMRSTGMLSTITQQPIQGRQLIGGLRMGEMERDAFIAHSAPDLLFERLCYSSDKYTAIICTRCNHFAYSDVSLETVRCRYCEDKATFGKVRIPYVFKLLQQYLNGMGIDFLFHTKKVDKKLFFEEERTGLTGEVERSGEEMEETVPEFSPEFQ